jgi:hypothetical protein
VVPWGRGWVPGASEPWASEPCRPAPPCVSPPPRPVPQPCLASSVGLLRCLRALWAGWLQQVALRKLLVRTEDAAQAVPEDRRIPLPFVVISAGEETAIHVEIDTPDRYAVTLAGACVHVPSYPAPLPPTVVILWFPPSRDLFFNFTGPFEVHDDSEILRRLALQKVCSVVNGCRWVADAGDRNSKCQGSRWHGQLWALQQGVAVERVWRVGWGEWTGALVGNRDFG